MAKEPQVTCRVGETNKNNQGYAMKIIEYKKYSNILVEFQDEYKSTVRSCYSNFKKGAINNPSHHFGDTSKTTEGYFVKIIGKNEKNYIVEFQDEFKHKQSVQYDTFLNGNIKNPYHKSVVGIGYIGNAITSYGKSQAKQSYKTWKHMLERCYIKREGNRDKTYIDCFVCDEWHCYANFEIWYDENCYEVVGEKIQIDKDILVKGNRLYSPETCVFIPQKLNNIFRSNNININFKYRLNGLNNYKNKIPKFIYDKVEYAINKNWSD